LIENRRVLRGRISWAAANVPALYQVGDGRVVITKAAVFDQVRVASEASD